MTSCDTTLGVARESTNGYSTIYDPRTKKKVKAHRYVWERANGPIPKGMVIMHTCDNRACTNLEHLQLGTQSDNLKDMYSKGRQGDRDLPSGERHHTTKVTREDVMKFRDTHYYKGLYNQWANAHGVSRQTARNIYTGKTWNYKPPTMEDLV
jgi:hypothetical protein